MLVQQLKERTVKRRICCICKSKYENNVFEPSENRLFEKFSGPDHGGSYNIDTGCPTC